MLDDRLLRMHPWVWLNEPQHAAAVGAVLSVVTTFASLTAVYFAWRAYTNGSAQLEGSAMPFLGLSQETVEGQRVWVLKNGGAGVAINVQAQWLTILSGAELEMYPPVNGSETLLLLDPIPVGDRCVLCPVGSPLDVVKRLIGAGIFYIQYDSLQGKAYRTIVYSDGQRRPTAKASPTDFALQTLHWIQVDNTNLEMANVEDRMIHLRSFARVCEMLGLDVTAGHRRMLLEIKASYAAAAAAKIQTYVHGRLAAVLARAGVPLLLGKQYQLALVSVKDPDEIGGSNGLIHRAGCARSRHKQAKAA